MAEPLRVRFGDYELDEARNELRRGGSRIELQPKPLQLLFYLARNRDRVVPDRELFDEVWPDVIVSRTALSSALSARRSATMERFSTRSRPYASTATASWRKSKSSPGHEHRTSRPMIGPSLDAAPS